jgi:adenylosuccinate synthase
MAAPQASEVARELELLQSEQTAERWLLAASEVARRVTLAGDEALQAARGPIVFEGAQGVLLDERVGFHPFTTYSCCTPDTALDLLARVGFKGPVETLGVLRAYAVRHGPGPLPTEDLLVSERTAEPHNQHGPWQGPVRKGWLDLVLLDYAVRAARRIDALAVTHLDSLHAFPSYRWCARYAALSRLDLPRNISEQASLTTALTSAEPLYTTTTRATGESPQSLLQLVQDRTSIHAKYGSVGPTASSVFLDGDP